MDSVTIDRPVKFIFRVLGTFFADGHVYKELNNFNDLGGTVEINEGKNPFAFSRSFYSVYMS